VKPRRTASTGRRRQKSTRAVVPQRSPMCECSYSYSARSSRRSSESPSVGSPYRLRPRRAALLRLARPGRTSLSGLKSRGPLTRSDHLLRSPQAAHYTKHAAHYTNHVQDFLPEYFWGLGLSTGALILSSGHWYFPPGTARTSRTSAALSPCLLVSHGWVVFPNPRHRRTIAAIRGSPTV
jgi:hypothetical protein